MARARKAREQERQCSKRGNSERAAREGIKSRDLRCSLDMSNVLVSRD